MSHSTDSTVSIDQSALRRWVWILGLAGLIPFVGHVVGMFVYPAPPVPSLLASSQILYTALVITFIGALHWGVALADPSRYGSRLPLMLVWGVMPSIYVWVVAQLTQHRALILLLIGLIIVLAVDVLTYRRQSQLQWLIKLRLTLTAVASACLLITWLRIIQ